MSSQIFLQVDSLLIKKIDSLTQLVQELSNKASFNPYIPLLSALAGGGLVLLGQFIERLSRKKSERRKEIVDAFSNSERLLFNIKSVLKDLSNNRNLVSYWHYAYLKEKESKEMDHELCKKYYDTCLECSNKAFSCNTTIGELLAEYYSALSKINLLSGENISLINIENFLTKTPLKPARDIQTFIRPTEALEIFNLGTDDLYNDYLISISKIDDVQNKFLELLNTKYYGKSSKKSSSS